MGTWGAAGTWGDMVGNGDMGILGDVVGNGDMGDSGDIGEHCG